MLRRTRSFWAEFKTFAVKGNVVDLAIAVVIGNAFTGVVNALVADLVTPLMGLLTGNVDFKKLSLTLSTPISGGTPLTLSYGAFLQSLFNFIVISLSIFLILKFITATRRSLFSEGEQAVPPEEKPAQERLLEEIRDLLKVQQRS